MDIKFTKHNSNLIFAELKREDVFYLPNFPTYFYMVIDPVEYVDVLGVPSVYNCVCLNNGFLDYIESSYTVKLCKATINIEG